MKLLFNFMSLLFIFLLNSCHPEKFPGKPLHVRNNSSEYIYYWYSDEYTMYHYPNIILPTEKPIFIDACNANNSNMSSGRDPDYATMFSQFPEGKLSMYFFDKLATTQEEWEDVRLNHMVLRKDVTFEELKNNDYDISYP